MSRTVRILATSDIHGYVFPFSYADRKPLNQSLSRVSTLIKKFRDENTILIDNGDVLEGSPLTFYHHTKEESSEEPMTKVMRHMHYDYVNLGNHDFNYGPDTLFAYLNGVGCDCITANVLYHGQSVGKRYTVHTFPNGVRIALFGVDTHYIPNWEQPENIVGFAFCDALETAKQVVREIREKESADFVVGVYHGGFERDLENGEPTEDETGENQGWRMCAEIDGLDLLITGHQHRSLSGVLNGTAYTQTFDNGRELAVIELDGDTKEIRTQVLKAECEPDEELLELLQDEEDRCQIWLDQPLGRSAVDLVIHDENDARVHKSQLITFLNKVTLEATGAQIAANALFLHATGFPEQITMRDLVSTYVYPNTLVVKQVTGKVLREYLEKDAEFFTARDGQIIVSPQYDYPKPQHFNYDMLDGIEYTICVSNPIGSRITRLTRFGKDIADDEVFTLAVNNYRAAGGGNFNMIKTAPIVKEIQNSMVEILAEYIMKHPVIDFEPVNNIQVIL